VYRHAAVGYHVQSGLEYSVANEKRNRKDRRAEIARALCDCISDKGYASSTLTDVGLQAGMSPSHLQYYFQTKDAILEYYFDSLCTQLVEDAEAIDDSLSAEAWIDAFATYCCSGDRKGMRITMEIFGVAVHNPNLYARKVEYDKSVMRVLERFFKRVGCRDGIKPIEAAEKVRALDQGYKLIYVFSPSFSNTRFLKILKSEMLELCGLDSP